MNRAAEFDGRLLEKGTETGLARKDQAVMVHRLEKQDMTVELSCRGHQEPAVELALGSEARSFALSEIHPLLANDD